MPEQSGNQWTAQDCAPPSPSEKDISAKDGSSLPQPRAMGEVVTLGSHDYLPLRACLDMHCGSLVPQDGDVFPWEMHQREEACSPDVDSLVLIQEALRTLER